MTEQQKSIRPQKLDKDTNEPIITIPLPSADMLERYASGNYRSPQYSWRNQCWTMELIPNTNRGGH